MQRRDETHDRLLVRECLAGSEAAWQEFYTRFIGLVRNVIRRKAGLTWSDSQDIAQSVFLELATALNGYDPEISLSHFICVITERVCIDEFRKERAAKRHAETRTVDHHDAQEEGAEIVRSNLEPQDCRLEKAELSLRLKDSMNELDVRCRELLTLRYYKELPFSDIAEKMGISENTVTVQTRRCLDKLRNAFTNRERKG
ncbi:MAG TPA: sigma-70 family RNA polymerase sigma factor [Desulfomonilaceae bacterium]|nr:sigma-70 family RNA polymerase sigma factor [Desulfomonilaceae bacterium]